MSPLAHARCHVCGDVVANPCHSFDRRIATLGATGDGAPAPVACRVVFDEALFVYCSEGCWDVHQAEIARMLALASTYPPAGFVVPCSRCGEPVDRTEPHVDYGITVTRIADEGILMGFCHDDRDFAVLCRHCEVPEPVVEEGGWVADPLEATP
ncbi:MAG: hypothetical protein U1F10_03355 [Burkholderiales bacterium]